MNSPLQTSKTVHMVCNAHLDPVWMWEWEEGAAAAISTFRTAADLCEEFDEFVFNHNEVILYRWVEEYEPELFRRIQKLVKAGKWHIMGGWYLQPDCNMPSGESFIRQILLGRRYFEDKFGVTPTTAINFDPFGHTRGLVQIMAKSGFSSYICCRPGQEDCPLESNEFIWEGFDGSRVLVSRRVEGYLSFLGMAREKIETQSMNNTIVLWGVGDHGGGPSRYDLERIRDLIQSSQDINYKHSTPEEYFKDIEKRVDSLPVHYKSLNPWAVGCYTSQIRVKQHHRLLENELYSTEKMAAAAWCQGLMEYPQDEFQEAMRDLATAEFHDILPGSSIQPAEEMALRLMDHGLEILSRLKARSFFALAKNQPRATEGQIPILVYNPHPFPIKKIVECEFGLPDFNYSDTFTQIDVYQGETRLPAQVEKEISNMNLDWRKRVSFSAELSPSQMNRFDCQLTQIPAKPAPELKAEDGIIHFKTDDLDVIINASTGLIDRYRVRGVDYLEKNACSPVVVFDDSDPWGMRVRSFRNLLGYFSLLPPDKTARFSGVKNPSLPPVRVIEDGAVRTVVEAVMGYGDSTLCLHYKLPKQGTQIEVEVRVYWNEKDRMLKLSLPTPAPMGMFQGQVAYGVENLPENGEEAVAQKWVSVVAREKNTALTVINDGIYGSDFYYGELRLTLLRSPAYSCHPIVQRPYLPNNRFTPRIDQGERLFRFWINGGPVEERMASIDREALVCNEKLMTLSFFPHGGSGANPATVTLSDEIVQMTALKKAEDSEELVIRLFEPTGHPRKTTITLPFTGLEKEISLKGFEIRTFCVNPKTGTWREVNLVEKAFNSRPL